ncbi:hypothetical protein [Filimonas effusa]|uniref:Uncharacterized protein n=1 Tax=Filimonas effusa TaxID=2508721 RepID=A0A4Q1D1G7_9BACT|nr:hypothetical protein [Filimonas effusa]RXK81696.1 hypothetical protein ESB13_18035 [Filimonas effusa]
MNEIIITNEEFVVDLFNNCIRQNDNRDNKILLSDMEVDKGTGLHRFLFDYNTKNVYKLPQNCHTVPMDVAYIELPPMRVFTQNKDNVLSSQTPDNFSLEISSSKFVGREIPIMTLLSVDFLVDTRNKEFTQLSNRENKIPFTAVGLDKKTEIFQLNYCTGIKNLVSLSNDRDSLKATINIPGLWNIDPVGEAIWNGKISGFKQTEEYMHHYRMYHKTNINLSVPKKQRTVNPSSSGRRKRNG